MAIALLMVAWSQVTITDPLPDLIAASSTKDHVTVREDPTVCGANPAAVLRTRVGDQYSIEHVCRRPRRRIWTVSLSCAPRLNSPCRAIELLGVIADLNGLVIELAVRFEPLTVGRDPERHVVGECLLEALRVEHARERFDAVDQSRT